MAQVYYGDYLQLDRLLASQLPLSTEEGGPAHDEMLFIIVHQAYELWFKQMIWEIDDVLAIFGADRVDEDDMGRAVSRLRRIVEIEDLLIRQVAVLETMTPLDFLEFRDFLFPASGFQSAQFRIFENKLGVRTQDRLLLEGAPYTARLTDEDRARVEQSEREPSLFDGVERWLERTPFLEKEDYQFWGAYRQAVGDRLEADRQVVAANPNLTEVERASQLREFEVTMDQYRAVFDPERHAQQQKAGKRRLGYRAFQAALFINLYRDQPALQEPYRLLEGLMDVEEGLTAWRHRHAQMALRMIGRRVGTGGSAGAKYLERSAERSRVFTDLFDLSTFLVPRADRPPLPASVEEAMRFRYQA